MDPVRVPTTTDTQTITRMSPADARSGKRAPGRLLAVKQVERWSSPTRLEAWTSEWDSQMLPRDGAVALRRGGTRWSCDLRAALPPWERRQLAVGRAVLERTRRNGDKSQFQGTWRPGDPELVFGLYEPGH
jgi:hypothetical protein